MVSTKTRLLTRLNRAVGGQGLIPFLKRQARVTYNRFFYARLCVWVWEPGMPLTPESPGICVKRIDSADCLSDRLLQELIAGDGPSFQPRMAEEFDEGGVLWVATIDGNAAGYQWSRNGRFVKNWHFDLNERDALIYSTVTFYDFRGRGVGPTLMGRICREEVAAEGRACADCMVWNTPAVRFIEKTGFRKVAERKPLAAHPD